VSKKKVTYLQGVDELAMNGHRLPTTYEIKIQPDDQLAISISASERELLEPFTNKVTIGGGGIGGGANGIGGARGGQLFTVDKTGCIEFPVFGLVKVAGYTRTELARMLEQRLKTGGYTQDPVCTVEIMSFKVVVIGEAGNQVITCSSERLTILEAIAKSGGIRYTGKRQDALVLREEQGVVKSYRVDLSNAEATLNSPVYFLQQNDLIYIEPNGAARVDGSPFYRYMSAISSVIGFASTILTVILIAK
jgi:polysaccharide export outer membrane protein